ncbi:MAG: putative zinc-binding metallopeptidase [Minwuia sp.]|nr:putative zinc-binding metallopeptidase [Minwuia sp.]
MKIFTCGSCTNPIYFENTACMSCGAAQGFVPDTSMMVALDADGSATLVSKDGISTRYLKCSHHAQDNGCNWMIQDGDIDHDGYCLSCRLNHTIPDLDVPGHRALWHRLEAEKRRLVHSCLRLRLDVSSKAEREDGLAFDFLADPDPSFSERGRVLTGHDAGLITINIAEADPAARIRMREQMDEPYRTILGHFRHESGHFYWDRLIAPTAWLDSCRQLFGDERQDYGEALEAHYTNGPRPDWRDHHISSYAASHPWEDWAESWSHYLLMMDTLDTAWNFGVRTSPRKVDSELLESELARAPYQEDDFDRLMSQWMPLTVALNSLNRSMGQEDAYPFALAAPVIEKLRFVHRVVRGQPL